MSPTVALLIPFAAAVLSLLLVLSVLLKLYRRCDVEDISTEWLESFSPSSYYPMPGLLAEDDFRFLSRQPGFDLSLYRKLRRERLHIFRQYLSRLIVDFNRLHTAARIILAHSPEDQSHLVSQLIWLKVKFGAAVVRAEFSYGLCCLGSRTLAAHSMISRLEQMNVQLQSISSEQFA